jgi:hypothetical protein
MGESDREEQISAAGMVRKAAPQLLEALELIHGFGWRLDDSEHGREIKRRAEAAIRKAKNG